MATINLTTNDDNYVVNNSNNTVNGLAGNDTLTANASSVTLNGGAGDDLYWVNAVGVNISEQFGQGSNDVVRTTLSWFQLPENVEAVHGHGGNVVVPGQPSSFASQVNAAFNKPQTLVGNSLNNLIAGDLSNDTLYGMAGDDLLDGEAGDDTMIGGEGNDSYRVYVGTDTIIEAAGEGTDSVATLLTFYKLPAFVEELFGFAANANQELVGNGLNNRVSDSNNQALNDTLRGGWGNDKLTSLAGSDDVFGGAGNDWLETYSTSGTSRLYGGSGNDTMVVLGSNAVLFGGAGNDVYVINTNANFDIDENRNGGQDTVRTSLNSFDLNNVGNVEHLRGSSDGGQSLTGNDAANVISGGQGDDVLNGGKGNDVLRGRFGSDQLDGGQGTDRVSYIWASSGVTVALDGSVAGTGDASGDTFDSIEDLAGSAFGDDTLIGDRQDNTMFGWNGDDRLIGRAGDDVLVGGMGKDTLTGGAGKDHFDFNFVLQSASSNQDMITDFETANDVIDLSTIDANSDRSGDQDFSFIRGADFSGKAGQLRIETVNGNTLVEADINGDGSADFQIELYGLINLTSRDFIL